MTVIRQPIWRGLRPVSGLLLAATTTDDALQHWQKGAALVITASGELVLRWAEPVEMRCELGPHTPLIDIDGRLFAVDLGAATDARRFPPGALIYLKHGAVQVGELSTPMDPTDLLDLAGWEVAQATPSAEPHPAQTTPSKPSEPPPAAAEIDFDSRQALGGHQAPTARDRRRQQKVQASQQAAARAQTNKTLSDWLSKRRHQKYLDDLTNLFDADRLEEALRLAIPLGDSDGPTAKGRFGPRRVLTLRPNRPAARSVVRVQAGLRNQLQNRYRQAFVRLDQQRRVLDAAFVMADLLNRVGEACSYLERHGQMRLAAELSEARSHDQAETVRLWWRAGDRQRAVTIARRHGVFPGAIARLERSRQYAEAADLRRAWTAQLLQAGDIVGAYDVIADQHDDVSAAIRARLVDLGCSEQGPLRARMLARQLRAKHDAPHPALDQVLTDPLARPEREVLVAELTTTRLQVDHPLAVRTLLRRVIAERPDLSAKTLETLSELTSDPILREDLPLFTTLQPAADPETVWIDVHPADRGQVAIGDARVLPDGRLIVTLRGVGIRVVKPNGKTEAEFDLPADELILSDNGLHLLALRLVDDGVVTVRQITLPERRVRTIGDIPANVWAQTYDGGAWYHANGSHLIMLDVLADGPSALWRQTRHHEPIVAIARSQTQMAVASYDPSLDMIGPHTIRRYLLPNLNELRPNRDGLGPGRTLEPTGEVTRATATDHGYLARIESATPTGITVVAVKRATDVPLAVVRLGEAIQTRIRIDNGHLVTVDNFGRVEIVDLKIQRHRAYRGTV
jgi:hypothetical protein